MGMTCLDYADGFGAVSTMSVMSAERYLRPLTTLLILLRT